MITARKLLTLGTTFFLGILCTAQAIAQSIPAQKQLSTDQLRQDLAYAMDSIRATHPDPSHSMDEVAFNEQEEQMAKDVRGPLDIDQAWRVFAKLNPIMADGHLLIGYSDWVAATKEHLHNGGVLFPFEVVINDAGKLIVTAKLGGGSTPYAGRAISSINGIGADEVTKTLLARMHGDTTVFRSSLLSNRWWFFYWKMYGAPERFDIVIGGSTARLAGSDAEPVYLAKRSVFDKAFSFKKLLGHAALLTVNTFSWADRAKFYAFTGQVFKEIKDEGIDVLIVDVRQNGGGDDDMWMQGILRYIADKPYRWASGYEKKVTPGHVDAGQQVGEIVRGHIDRLIQPQLDDPLHYSGKLYLLVGRQTYSSAVLFSNTVQDFKFGTVAGQGGVVRTAQTGGIQSFTLPNSGLTVTAPRFILTRPSGEAMPIFVEPDVRVTDDPLRPMAAVEEVLRIAGAEAAQQTPRLEAMKRRTLASPSR
ncbi:S41 family peptidase [Dyella jiangningensis]|uniref:S41 family peptidase n=1 Tax=Dyella jiangningensis TaxID=1379159 RepID=UPI00240F6F83|nr:S41 family peptidase [Dyella jiangningensis]MDG2536830.1 S41 family peptidase [Dyella jiangningensis]